MMTTGSSYSSSSSCRTRRHGGTVVSPVRVSLLLRLHFFLLLLTTLVFLIIFGRRQQTSAFQSSTSSLSSLSSSSLSSSSSSSSVRYYNILGQSSSSSCSSFATRRTSSNVASLLASASNAADIAAAAVGEASSSPPTTTTPPRRQKTRPKSTLKNNENGNDDKDKDDDDDGTFTQPSSSSVLAQQPPLPQVFSSGHSQAMDLVDAIHEAVAMALEGLPPPPTTTVSATTTSSSFGSNDDTIDLAMISVSSLYDGTGGSATAASVIPALLEAATTNNRQIKHVIGSTCGGVIGSRVVVKRTSSDATTTTTTTTTTTATTTTTDSGNSNHRHNHDDDDDDEIQRQNQNVRSAAACCQPVEKEGVPCVSVTLCLLPDVRVETFHVDSNSDSVPENWKAMSSQQWKQSVGLLSTTATATTVAETAEDEKLKDDDGDDDDDKVEAVFLLPSPAFVNKLDDFLGGMELHMTAAAAAASSSSSSFNTPSSFTTNISPLPPTIFGAVASTVSSLSRARLFRYNSDQPKGIQTHADGCLGVVFRGDIQVKTVLAQGAKPVGGVYQIVKGQDSTIATVALDEAATELVRQAEEEEEEEEEDDGDGDDDEGNYKEVDLAARDRASQMAAAYAKARIPKPVLAEANFLMRTLSDDDQAFMGKTILVGLERSGALGRVPSELARLTEGRGHAFAVHQVASAAMKDGSVTLPLGVNVDPGKRMRFFVRESNYAKEELEALWTGFKKRNLPAAKKGDEEAEDGEKHNGSFRPTGCFVFPTLDRGNKFFLGKTGFESSTVAEFLPTVPSISGFFCNGVIGILGTAEEKKIGMNDPLSLVGSATSYILMGSKSGRPVFVPEATTNAKVQSDDDASNKEKTGREELAFFGAASQRAPRDEQGELVLRRREVHSGRAMTVSTVEWSVAEKVASPTSTLEGFMWDKETEVDRFRERVPLANLVSQCKLYTLDPSKPKPRDWVGTVKERAAQNGGRFVIVPECKRLEPFLGSIRKRYDVSKLAREFTAQGAPAISVNCDGILFGGSLDDIAKAREATSNVSLEVGSGNVGSALVPPILASDLLLYPYQLYKIRLAGADAVNLVVGALASKDLLYLTKIASSLAMQALLTVTSVAQVEKLMSLPPNSIDGLVVSNRELEGFSFDITGSQALEILQSDAIQSLRNKHGNEFPILVEGRVGIIGDATKPDDEDAALSYIRQLQEAGAMGAIIGGGLALNEGLVKKSSNNL